MKKCSVIIVLAMLMGLAGVQQAGAAVGDLLGDVALAFVFTPGTSDDPDGSGGQFQHQSPGAGLWPDDWDGGGPDGRDLGTNWGGVDGTQTLPYVELGGVHSGKNWVNVGLSDPADPHYILSWFGGGSAANLGAGFWPLPDPANLPPDGVPYLRSQMEFEVRLVSGPGANVSLRHNQGTGGPQILDGVVLSPDIAGINDRVSFSGEVWNEWFHMDLRGVAGGEGAVVEMSWTQVEIPEPVTMSLLGLGSLVVLRRRRRA